MINENKIETIAVLSFLIGLFVIFAFFGSLVEDWDGRSFVNMASVSFLFIFNFMLPFALSLVIAVQVRKKKRVNRFIRLLMGAIILISALILLFEFGILVSILNGDFLSGLGSFWS